MERVYPSRINWQNLPSTATPVNETNLNKIDYAVYEIDGRVVDFDTTKANQSDLLQTLNEIQNARIGADGVTYNTLGEAISTNDRVNALAIATNGRAVKDWIAESKDAILQDTNSNYWLNASGKGESQSGYTFNKYYAFSGDVLYLKIPQSNSPCSFRFSATAAGNSDVIGDIYKDGFEGIVSVPNGAKFIFISCLTSNINALVVKIIGAKDKDERIANGFIKEATLHDTNPGYWLNATGGGESRYNFTMNRYYVRGGEVIYVDIPSSVSPVTWRFGNSFSGSPTSVTGALHTTGYKGYVRVPNDACALFVAFLTGDTSVKIYRKLDELYGINRGLVFVEAHNGKVYVRTTPSATLSFGGNNYLLKNYQTVIEYDLSTNYISYLVFDTSVGFKMKTYTDAINENEMLICKFFGNQISFSIENVIPNENALITKWYQRQDIPTYINQKKINGYKILPAPYISTYVKDYGSFYKFTNKYNENGEAISYFYDGILYTFDNNTKFYQNNVDISNKKILTIGDSFTKRGWYQKQIQDHVNSVEFVGTQDTNYNNLKCEGYSGARSNEVFGQTVLGNTSPFWNPSEQKVDYAYYAQQNNIDADMIVIMFGLNEVNKDNYFNSIQNFITSVKDYNSSIIVYVVQPCVESEQASVYHNHANAKIAEYYCGVVWYDFEDCVKIPMRTTMVDEYDYEAGSVPYGYGNINVAGTSDAVHPSEDVGFKKIGDQIYNWLGITSNA